MSEYVVLDGPWPPTLHLSESLSALTDLAQFDFPPTEEYYMVYKSEEYFEIIKVARKGNFTTLKIERGCAETNVLHFDKGTTVFPVEFKD